MSFVFIERFYKNGKLHREDGPALVHQDGSLYWYVNGRLHRIGAPAIMSSTGHNFWYIHGQMYINTREYQRDAKLSNEDVMMMTLTYGTIRQHIAYVSNLL